MPDILQDPKVCLEEFSEEYPEIYKYLNAFQVKLSNDEKTALLVNMRAPRRLKSRDSDQLAGTPISLAKPTHKLIIESSITVFKTKNLKNLKRETPNIYEHNLSSPDIDLNDSNKSKVSCIRCRKFKKKCSRIFPECSNCSSSDELCVYLPRKVRSRDEKDKGKRNEKRKATEVFAKNNSSLYKDNFLPYPKRLSLPNIPANGILTTNELHAPEQTQSSNNYHYNARPRKHSKDLHMLLN